MRFEKDHALAQPVAIRRATRIDAVNRGAVEQAVFNEIDRQHLAGSESTLGDDALLGHIPKPGLGSDDQMAIIAL